MAYPVKGYLLEQSEFIKEIDSEAIIYRHERTKARVLVIPNEDPHKSFCVGFRTPPNDSTGVAHIIEHSVLCGSRKYPLKDPFVELAKGSLNTYLNAMTYPDKTLYPVSSQNDKDFHNLMDVYLDAVFFPNIYKQKEIMMQEGWRYHIESVEAPIEYKGVVYNEMKGAFSSPEEIGFRLIKETLFPDTTYSNESGGAPSAIPDLTYEAFIAFHKKYYHPSNAYICLYGDMNLQQTLEYIDTNYLSKFEYLPCESEIKTQSTFNQPVCKKGYYSASEEKDNGLFLSYNTVVGETGDRKLMLAMAILEYVLLDTPASPLKKALIAEGIGEDVYGAFQTHLKQPIFSIVAKNVSTEKRERFYSLIEEVLKGLIREGIPRNLLKGALQVKAFELREADSSGYSKGLFYSLAAMKSWIYDENPLIYLKYEQELEALKAELSTGYFEALIEKYLINNTHEAKVELEPKLGLEREMEEAITKKLESYKNSLSKTQLEALIQQTQAFNGFQEQEDSAEAVASIPLLAKEDLRRKAKYPRYQVVNQKGIDYITTPIFTNKIAYINWYVKLEGIDTELLPYIGLLVGMLGKLDTQNFSYEALSSYMDEHIGSMSFHIQGINDMKSIKSYHPIFFIQSKALVEEVKEQNKLLREVLTATTFDNENRILEVLREMKALMESSVAQDGHRVAYGRLLSHLSGGEAFEEMTKGLSFYQLIGDLEKNWQSKKQETIMQLKEAYKCLNNRNRVYVGLCCDEELLPQVMELTQEEIEKLEEKPVLKGASDFEITEEKEALIYPSSVNYVSAGYNYKALGYEYHGGLMMLKSILSMNYLWSKVRVQNGAYGCFCDFRKSGSLYFVSYRDPNIDQTLDIYRGIPEFVNTLALGERELLQYLIGTVSQLDFPYTPASEARTAQTYYLAEISEKELQVSRDELFETNNETLQQFAPMLKKALEASMYCVFGNEQSIKTAQTEFIKETKI